MEKKGKMAAGELFRNTKKQVTLLLSSIAHALGKELRSLGGNKAEVGASALKTAFTHFHIFR